MKRLSIPFIICIFICSCSKINTEQSQKNPTPDLEFTPTVIDGTLSFKNHEEVIKAINFLSKLSLTERKKWEEKNGFYSIRRRVSEGYEAINKANQKESLEDLNKALKDYKDVIFENDTAYCDIYPSTSYQLITNRKSLYIASNLILKSTPEQIEVYGLEDLNRLNNGIQIEPLKQFSNYYYKHPTGAKYTNSDDITREYFDNPDGCKHDRRVYVHLADVVEYYPSICTDSTGFQFDAMVGFVLVEVCAYGTYRNWLCKWSNYSTELAWRNVSFSVYGFQNNSAAEFPIEVCNAPNTSSEIVLYSGAISPYSSAGQDRDRISEHIFLGNPILNENDAYINLRDNYLGFVSAHAEATSRGVGFLENWAIIDQ
jgi:hypothetical protein